jgi:hypothetical protein
MRESKRRRRGRGCLRFLADRRIATRAHLLTDAECERIIALAEANASGCGWGAADDYEQATTDLEVDRAPALRDYLVGGARVVDRVADHVRAAHGVSIRAFDDVFVVKYDAAKQRSLVAHTDAGDVSFMVALSPRADYDGGGTRFAALDGDVVHLDRGAVLTFEAAGCWHGGNDISRGTRYLLVGFCFARDPAAAATPGNLDLALAMIT